MNPLPPLFSKHRLLRPALVSAGYLALFLLLSQASLGLRGSPGAAMWYPPSGLSLALLLAGGPVYAPLVFLAVLLGGVWVFALPLTLYLVGVAALTALAYTLAALFLRRLSPEITRLASLKEITLFALAAIVVPLLLAGMTATLLVMGGAVSSLLFVPAILQIWLYDTLSNLMLAPILLLFGRDAAALRAPRVLLAAAAANRRAILLAALQAASVVLALWVVFGLRVEDDRRVWYLLFLPLMWVVLHFGLRGALLAAASISAGALAAVQLFHYPLSSFDDLQAFLLLLALVGLLAGGAFSERREAERALRHRLAIEERIASISTRLINLRPDRVAEEIRRTLAEVGEFFGVEGAHLLLFGPDRKVELAYGWAAPGVDERTDALVGWSMARLPWMLRQLERGEIVHLPDPSSFPPEAQLERAYFAANRLRSMITVPLGIDHQLVGTLGFHSTRLPKTWRDEDIRLLRLVADMLLDLLKRQQAEARIRESDLKFRSIVLQSYDGIVLVDRDGKVIEWNRGQERITGLRRTLALGRPVWDVQYELTAPEHKAPIQRDLLRADFEKILATGGPGLNRLAEIDLLRPDGERRRIQTLVFPIRTGLGFMAGMIARDVTDLRRGEEDLRGSQASLAEAEQLAHLGHFRIALPEGAMEWSDETYDLLEWDRAVPTPDLKTCLGFIHPDDRARVYECIDRVLQDKQPVEFEYRLPFEDGRVKTIASIGRPVLDAAGAVTHVFGTMMDITERKQAVEALQESERRYKELADSISDVFFGLDTQLNVTYWNKASEEMTGVPAERAIGQSLYEVFPRLKGSSIEQFAVEAVRSGQRQGFVMEYTVRGRKRYMEVSAYPGKNGVSVFLRDVTERQAAEERLRHSEARYRAVVEDQTDMICRFTPDGTITFVNEAYCRTFARHRRDMVGQKMIRLNAALGEGELSGQRTLLRGPARAATYECQTLLPDGRLHWLQWTDRPILDDQGRVVEVQAVGRDISESKRLEEELRYISTHDVMTGIYNRAFFEAELARLQRSRRYPISVLMVDVNGLKSINDTYGHTAGDDLLRRAARVLSSCFRPEDVVARYGGDEFAVLLPATDGRAADEVVERVRTSLEVYNRGSGGPSLSLSVGIATGEKASSLLEVLSRADERMYQDKGRQKNGK